MKCVFFASPLSFAPIVIKLLALHGKKRSVGLNIGFSTLSAGNCSRERILSVGKLQQRHFRHEVARPSRAAEEE
jgi:hypothetical protein